MKGQQTLTFQTRTGNLVDWTFNQEQTTIAKMILMHELPFKFIESEGLCHFTVLCSFILNSSFEAHVLKDCMGIYKQEGIWGMFQRACVTIYCLTLLTILHIYVLLSISLTKIISCRRESLTCCVIPRYKGKQVGKNESTSVYLILGLLRFMH